MPALGQHPCGQSFGGLEQRQEQMLGADETVSEAVRLLFGAGEDGSGPLGEPLDVGNVEGEPLVGGLLAHAEGSADLGPGMPAAAALIDEMTQEGVAGLFEVGHGPRSLGQLEEWIPGRRIRTDAVDEFLQCRSRSHSSTLY